MPNQAERCERSGCSWQREPNSRYCHDHTQEQQKWQWRFDTFMAHVNAELEARTGVGSSDLPDFNYADHFDAGTDPAEIARMVLEDFAE